MRACLPRVEPFVTLVNLATVLPRWTLSHFPTPFVSIDRPASARQHRGDAGARLGAGVASAAARQDAQEPGHRALAARGRRGRHLLREARRGRSVRRRRHHEHPAALSVNPANADARASRCSIARRRLSIIVDDLRRGARLVGGDGRRRTEARRARESRRRLPSLRHRSGLAARVSTIIKGGQRLSAACAFRGLLSHAGHAYGAAHAGRARGDRRTRNRDPAVPRRPGCARPASRSRKSASARRRRARFITLQQGVTEMRPGNYVFFDRTQVGLGAATARRLRAVGSRDGRQPAGRDARRLRRGQQDADERRRARLRHARRARAGVPGPRRHAPGRVDRDRAAVRGTRGRARAGRLHAAHPATASGSCRITRAS